MSSSPVTWLILFAAIGFSLWQWRKINLGFASREWKPIKCQIVKTWIDEQRDADESGASSYSAKVEYSYKISSVVYRSTRLSYRPTSGLTFEQAVDLISNFLPGREAVAYYNPRIKSQSVLVRGLGTEGAMPFVLSGLFTVLLG